MRQLKALSVLVGTIALLSASPAVADSLYVEGPNESLTSFTRPGLAVGNVVTVFVNETNTATSGASTSRSKDSRVRSDWDFGSLIPNVVKNAIDVHGRDDFAGQGVTSRNGKLQVDVSARIEEVMPNGMLRIVGHKRMRVNDEETEITIRGIIRPMDITPDNRVDSMRVADMQIDFKGAGPNTAKATPGLLTRMFNWLF